jgi:hypothetical protein
LELDANALKTIAMAHFRFIKQVNLITTECGFYNADIMFYKKHILHEIEVKTSIQDFKMDFKKQKHEDFKLINKLNEKALPSVPNYFSFLVPLELQIDALKILENHDNYGLYVISPKKHTKMSLWLKCVKRPKLLHNLKNNKIANTIISRMASEIINHRIKIYDIKYSKN